MLNSDTDDESAPQGPPEKRAERIMPEKWTTAREDEFLKLNGRRSAAFDHTTSG